MSHANVCKCPLCGSRAKLRKEDFEALLRESVYEIITQEALSSVDDIRRLIMAVNAGDPSPTEEKILSLIDNYINQFLMEVTEGPDEEWLEGWDFLQDFGESEIEIEFDDDE